MAIGLSSSQLAKMRAQTEELLPDTCVIQSPTNSTDSSGYPTQGYSAVSGGTVACRLDPLNLRGGQVEIYQSRETTRIMYQFTTEYDAPLLTDYQIVTGGNTYQVIQVDVSHSWNVSKRAIIAKVE